MYTDNLASLCPRIPVQETINNQSPQGHFQEQLCRISRTVIPWTSSTKPLDFSLFWICPSGHETIISLYWPSACCKYCPFSKLKTAARLDFYSLDFQRNTRISLPDLRTRPFRTMDLFILTVLWMDLSYTDLFRLDKTTHGITRLDFRSFLIA